MLALFGLTIMAEFPIELSPSVQLGKVSLTCKLEVRKYKLSWLIELTTDLWVSQAKNSVMFVPFSADPEGGRTLIPLFPKCSLLAGVSVS